MKKFAMIQMGEDYNPEVHKNCFSLQNRESYNLTVRNMEEACELAKKLVEEGFGAIELCGAFGEENARKLVEVTENKIPIGYVVNFPEQVQMAIDFFCVSEE